MATMTDGVACDDCYSFPERSGWGDALVVVYVCRNCGQACEAHH